MKLSFHGAAQTVTGSKHILHLEDGKKILFDCGLFQGLGADTEGLNQNFGFNPKEISVVLLSHAHIDHTGLIPKLVREGFSGEIWCTPATKELAEILLYDSAEIQSYETEAINKKRAATESPLLEALYNAEDVAAAMELFQTKDYQESFQPLQNVTVVFTNTGHLVGSAAIHVTVTETEKTRTVLFSGDVGRYHSVLLPPPAEFGHADYIILESTYGGKRHDLSFNTIKTIRQWVEKICIEQSGKLIIPAFSVGRTQEVLYALNQLSLEKRLPDLQFFIDSPLSLKATETVKKYTGLLNERLQQVMAIDDDPFEFSGLKYVESVADSQKLVDYKEPCVIISASGTADAGRVRHHINSVINDAKNGILFVGYCGPQSTGGQLLEGCSQVDFYGDLVDVKAEIGQVAGLSAHGDCDDLARFLSCQDPEKTSALFLVHGEQKVQEEFSSRLEKKGFINVKIPRQHEEFELL